MDQDALPSRNDPYLVASTATIHNNTSAVEEEEGEDEDEDEVSQSPTSNGVPSTAFNVHQQSNYFKSAQWSPDGTTLLTTSADNTLRTYILPPDLLSPPYPKPLVPYTTHPLPEPPYATTIHPAYTLSHPPTTLYLLSPRALPIRLISPFATGIVGSYNLVSATTEKYTAPHSLLFDTYASQGNTFFAGSDSEISVFDVGRNGSGPVSRMPTIPSRRKKVIGGGVGMKGIISTLAMSSEGILAAGTFSRWVGLYDSGGRGGTVGVFSLNTDSCTGQEEEQGSGITQLTWSACSRYLCIAERCSDGIDIWDIRGTGRHLAWLAGRTANTMQRLGIEVREDGEVWAGGTDGVVRVWEGVGRREGRVERTWEFGAHNDAVGSAVLHPSGSVLATCSGQRHTGYEVDSAWGKNSGSESASPERSSVEGNTRKRDRDWDNSLKVWAL